MPTVIASFCWSLPICKNSDALFWITLNTSDHSTWDAWKCYFCCFLTTCKKPTLFINSMHSWDKTDSLFIVNLGMFRHAWEHTLKQPIKYLVLFQTSNHIQKFSFIPYFFVRYCGLKNPAFWGFWIITQEPDFCKHVALAKSTKKHWHFVLKWESISKWIRFLPKS